MEDKIGDEEISALVAKLALAVELTMSPNCGQQERMEAFRLMEEFKDSSPHCPAVALQLAQDSQLGPVRRFGLQVLESCIKYRWTTLSISQKVFIKDNSMHLMAFRTNDLLEEPQFIKDALSRIIVEMIKQEWPQQWPEMLTELETLSQRGPTQTELVLFVFLRLVEDVVAFSAVPPRRRRELLTGLTSQMQNLFNFFLNTLDRNVTLYLSLKESEDADKNRESLACVKVSQAVLWTFTGYVDWVSMTLIFENNGRLLQMLCTLLSDMNLQLYAAECLLLIVSRKGTVQERKPLLLLFSEDAMNYILSAAVVATAAAVNEYHYLFLKKLCNILVAIGNQLCALWGSEPDVQQPPNFLKYLQAILAFTEHPSQMLGSMTQPLWCSFLRHEHISKDPVFKEYIVKMLETAMTSLAKIGYPSMNNSLSCGYSRIDFDNNDREFNSFFARYRADIMNTIRMATILQPTLSFTMATQRLDKLLKAPLVIGEGTETDHCNLSSPSYIEWDSMVSFVEAVMSRLSQSPDPQPDVKEGVEWLRAILFYQTKDPLILSLQLSCISALFEYLAHAPQLVDEILAKIFSTVVFNVEGQTKSNRTRAVQNVRRHACSGLVKLCKTYPKLIMPSFDRMYQHIQEIINKQDLLSTLEKITLTESAIIISNEFKDYEKQSAFLAEVLKPSKDIWLSKEIQDVFQTPERFLHFIGVDQAPVEPSSADTCGINRAKVQYCVSFIHSVILRSRWPTDPEEMRKGGFMIKMGEMEVPRNPATHQIGKMFASLFPLLKILNEIWMPENLKLRHPEFSQAYDLMERDKLQVLGVEPSQVVDNTNACNSKQPLERMQNFFNLLFENSYHVLGNAAQHLGYEFYSSNVLTKLLQEMAFHNIAYLPDHKLKPMIRVFMKPFVQYCPKESYETVVMPIINRLAPFMLERLCQKWQVINMRAEAGEEDDADDDKVSQECIEDQLCRQVTREYLELLGTLLFEKSDGTKSDQALDDSMAVEEENPANAQKEIVVSELGSLALRSESTCQAIVLTVFSALSWNSVSVSQRAVTMCWPIMKQLIVDKNMVEAVAMHLFQNILSGFEVHGQHDAMRSTLMTLALNAYEVLRPMHPDILNIMYMIPACTPAAVKKFDDGQLTSNPAKKVNEKKKKDAFKKLIAGVISENIGRRFKKEANYTALPPLLRKTKVRAVSLEDTVTDGNIGLCALFGADDYESTGYIL